MFDEDYGVQSYFGESGDCDFFGDTSTTGGFASGMGGAGFVSEAFAQDSMGGSFFTEASEFDSSSYGSYFTESLDDNYTSASVAQSDHDSEYKAKGQGAMTQTKDNKGRYGQNTRFEGQREDHARKSIDVGADTDLQEDYYGGPKTKHGMRYAAWSKKISKAAQRESDMKKMGNKNKD